MCGIAGLFSWNEGSPDPSRVEKMMAALAHRGPDDSGLFCAEHLVLGHQRLSILDLSEAGHQPMRYGQWVIVHNGEVYNYLELRDRLAGLGHEFETGTDTEVILHAFEEWGEGCVDRFNGMWSFAIADTAENRLHLCRDRFGIKPLYYHHDKNCFLFASEPKAIIACGIPARTDLGSVLDYLVVGLTDHSDRTFFTGISQLTPGHWLSVGLSSAGRTEKRRYYCLRPNANHETPESFAERLEDAVSLRLRSDVPVGTCLSGGLDSSTVAALAARMYHRSSSESFHAITAKSEIPETDETPFARVVSEHCGLNWHLVFPRYRDFSTSIERCLWHQDEPVESPSVVMQYCVMKAAREAGLTVMLDGQGGDETLLGYERYYPAYFWKLLSSGRLSLLAREYFLATQNSQLRSRDLASYSIYFLSLTVRRAYLLRRNRFVRRRYLELASSNLSALSQSFLDLLGMQKLELTQNQLPHLLRYEDRNSMAHSIEARVPFVDHTCVESAITLKPEDKIHRGYTKHALRKLAEQVLPPHIAWRRNKIGFDAPESSWLGRHRQAMIDEIGSSRILKELCALTPDLDQLAIRTRWRLFNIALWERQFDVRL